MKISRKIYGVLPMAGKGSRIQPIGFPKELYPVVYGRRHFAVSEFSVHSMLLAGVDEIKLVVNPTKMEIAKYYSSFNHGSLVGVYFFDSPSLPESCLFPIDGMHDDDICLFGLPDTIFAPSDGYQKVREALENGADMCLGLFEVEDGSKFDSVKLDENNTVLRVKVKQSPPLSNFIWGIWGAKVSFLKELRDVIKRQKKAKEKLLGVGFDTLLKKKKYVCKGVHIGNQYFDIGTIDAVINAHKVINDFKLNV